MHVGLSAWIIQDGNYPEFEAGKDYRFALEFGIYDIAPAAAQPLGLVLREGADYAFAGRTVVRSKELAIVDVGLLCFHEGALSALPNVGEFSQGRLYLGVDPFFWFEQYARKPEMPDLQYHWRVNGILLETTPWVESLDDSGRRLLERAPGAPSFRAVQRTNSWHDDGGSAHYVLECERRGLAALARADDRAAPGCR